jgi:hypothetical protein
VNFKVVFVELRDIGWLAVESDEFRHVSDDVVDD